MLKFKQKNYASFCHVKESWLWAACLNLAFVQGGACPLSWRGPGGPTAVSPQPGHHGAGHGERWALGKRQKYCRLVYNTGGKVEAKLCLIKSQPYIFL